MNALGTISPREASIFAAICDTVVAPEGLLPAVRDTDAAFALDASLAVAPPVNRAGLRAALYALELAPLALGFGARLRRLPRERREEALARLQHNAALGQLVKAVSALGHLCYYGDGQVMALLGYDASAVVARAAALREKEARW